LRYIIAAKSDYIIMAKSDDLGHDCSLMIV